MHVVNRVHYKWKQYDADRFAKRVKPRRLLTWRTIDEKPLAAVLRRELPKARVRLETRGPIRNPRPKQLEGCSRCDMMVFEEGGFNRLTILIFISLKDG